MLNYIWAGLIIFSLVFALWRDVLDLRSDAYRNGKPFPITVIEGQIEGDAPRDVVVRIDSQHYKAFYGREEPLAESYKATLVPTKKGQELRFAAASALPPRLAKVRDMTSADDPKWLQAEVYFLDGNGLGEIRFQPVRWASIQAIGEAAIKFSRDAVTLALGLIGTLALFLGVMQIAEKAGLIGVLVKSPVPCS